MVVEETMLGKSFMKSKNNNGPSTVPWGTPDVTDAGDDKVPSSVTCCVLSVRKAWIQLQRIQKVFHHV